RCLHPLAIDQRRLGGSGQSPGDGRSRHAAMSRAHGPSIGEAPATGGANVPKDMICAAAAALALTAGAALAQTQEAPAPQQGQMMGTGQGAGMPMMDRGPGTMGGPGTPWGRGMMGDGFGRGGMRPHMMLMMMALVDADASGTLSLEEVQAVHARMFQYADADENGELTVEELRAFMQGGPIQA